jgi:hypothetical protein
MESDTDWTDYIDDYDGIEESDWYDDHQGLYAQIPDLPNRVPAVFSWCPHRRIRRNRRLRSQ